tara:strand:+ start:398 stop:793 length:396 start_codon:yes stop_codon:yes gene_type:complete
MAEIYHATWPSKVNDILEEGLKPGFDGCVYLAGPLPAHAATFVALRGGEFDGTEEIEINGKMETVPKMIQHDKIFVFSVESDDLDPDLLHESFDHSATFFPEGTESWLYNGPIHPDDLLLAYEFDMAGVRS